MATDKIDPADDQKLAKTAKELAADLDGATSADAQKIAVNKFLDQLNELRDKPESAKRLVAYTAQFERQAPEKGAKSGLNIVAVDLKDGSPKVILQKEISDSAAAIKLTADKEPDTKATVSQVTLNAVHDAASTNPKNTAAWNWAAIKWDSETAENITSLAQLTKDHKAPEIKPDPAVIEQKHEPKATDASAAIS